MHCKIADLIVEIPEVGDLVPRCSEYKIDGADGADIIIRTDLFQLDYWPDSLSEDNKIYMESGIQFNINLLKFNGIKLHSSAVAMDNKAYLFSGPSGIGKSTHTRLWRCIFGDKAQIINDDKPALRRIQDKWYAYGTPWCGKDGINLNQKIPLAGICFLKQASENKIRKLSSTEASTKILEQTIRKFWKVEALDLLIHNLNQLIQEVPVFELENRPEPEAVHLSYEIMRRTAEEMGL